MIILSYLCSRPAIWWGDMSMIATRMKGKVILDGIRTQNVHMDNMSPSNFPAVFTTLTYWNNSGKWEESTYQMKILNNFMVASLMQLQTSSKGLPRIAIRPRVTPISTENTTIPRTLVCPVEPALGTYTCFTEKETQYRHHITTCTHIHLYTNIHTHVWGSWPRIFQGSWPSDYGVGHTQSKCRGFTSWTAW